MYDYKLHTGYIGTSAFERFKSHLPGDVVSHNLCYRVTGLNNEIATMHE